MTMISLKSLYQWLLVEQFQHKAGNYSVMYAQMDKHIASNTDFLYSVPWQINEADYQS